MRPECDRCARPASVCLCSVLPSQPLRTCFTSIIILQHPHEVRHPLATVPVLAKCIQNCEIIVGRRFRPGVCARLDALALGLVSYPTNKSSQTEVISQKQHVLLLFPGSKAVDLDKWLSIHASQDLKDAHDSEENAEESMQAGASPPRMTLLLVDGTWQHAKEMVKASLPYLNTFATQVCLPFDLTREGLGMGESTLTLRKEPFQGYMSTMEAAARALVMLEPHGTAIEALLLLVLEKMVSLQASFFTPLTRRPRKTA